MELADGTGENRRNPKGGVCRLTLTDLERQGRDLFGAWAQMQEDGIIVMRLAGRGG